MATEPVVYLTYLDAVLIHIKLMRYLEETRYGVFDRGLVESALSRPRHAAIYDHADLLSQAATLCYGLIKNHPWVGGNKRTATALMEYFLGVNGMEITADVADILRLVYAVEADEWSVDRIDDWLRNHTRAAL